MIRLDDIQENSIINDGKAGEVQQVNLTVVKKNETHNSNFPDFKFIFSKGTQSHIDIGLYHFSNKEFESEKENKKRQNIYLMRLMHITKAVMGQTFAPTEQFDSVFKATNFLVDIIDNNSKNKLFDIFINFGTTRYPSKKGFLEVRFATPFIKAHGDLTRGPLLSKEDDIMSKEELRIIKKEIEDNDFG